MQKQNHNHDFIFTSRGQAYTINELSILPDSLKVKAVDQRVKEVIGTYPVRTARKKFL